MVSKGLRWLLGGLVYVLRRVVAILPSTVPDACFRAVMLKKFLIDTLFVVLPEESSFFRDLYFSAETGSGFCSGGSRVYLATSDCRRRQRRRAGQYFRDAVSAHTRSDAVSNIMNDCFSDRAYVLQPFGAW